MITTRLCSGCNETKELSLFTQRNQKPIRRCKDCRNKYMRQYNARQGITLQKQTYQWKAKYGLSAEEYIDMFEKQEGACAICHTPPTMKALGVDHDHTSGKVRALLCSACNGALGLAKDNIDTLAKMIEYLNFHGGKK